jgi:hypothetical protein
MEDLSSKQNAKRESIRSGVTLPSICTCLGVEKRSGLSVLINRIFVLNSEVLDSSTFKIAVFRLSKRPFLKAEVIPVGEVLLSMGDISSGNQDVIGE